MGHKLLKGCLPIGIKNCQQLQAHCPIKNSYKNEKKRNIKNSLSDLGISNGLSLFNQNLFICMYRGSPLSTFFGTWKKSYYAKFVLVE